MRNLSDYATTTIYGIIQGDNLMRCTGCGKTIALANNESAVSTQLGDWYHQECAPASVLLAMITTEMRAMERELTTLQGRIADAARVIAALQRHLEEE